MAYVSKEKKQKIVAAAKKIIPADWKITFGVRHHSTIVATIQQAPSSVLTDYAKPLEGERRPSVNIYHIENQWKGETQKVLLALKAALDTDNFDHSDIQSDFFHCGHYVDIQFGKWDKAATFI